MIWVMAKIHIRSVLDPLDEAESFLAAVEVVTLSEAMGLLPPGEVIETIDLDTMRRVAARVADAGIGIVPAATLTARRRPGTEELRAAIVSLRDALLEAPAPESEWRLTDVLGVDRLATLLGIAVSSLRRYAAGSRTTPDDVAARLHFLATVVSDLRGAYTEVGIRRWFDRPRAALGGRAPAEVLGGGWSPDADSAARVRSLSRSLLGLGAT